MLRFGYFPSALALSALACSAPMPDPPASVCHGLDVRLLDQAVMPPAHVASLVRVTDCAGRALPLRLQASAFELAENGKVLSSFEAQRMIIPAERQQAQRTLILLDLSGSIVRAGLKPLMIEGARSLVQTLPKEHRIAVFGFDGRPDLIPFAYFGANRGEVMDALDAVLQTPTVDDSTNLNGAIVGALDVLDQAIQVDEHDFYTVAHGALVLFTDGADRAGRVSEGRVSRRLDDTAHSTFAIGIGPELDQHALGEYGRSGYVLVGDASGIIDAFEDVASDLRARAESDYVVSYCSPARAGGRTLTISVQHESKTGELSLDFLADGFGAGCAPERSPLR